MIIWNNYCEQLRHIFTLANPFFVKFLNKLADPELIGYCHIECGILPWCPAEKRCRNRKICKLFDTSIFVRIIIKSRFKHYAEAEIKKVNLIPFKMIPHRPWFIVIFGINSSCRSIHTKASRSFWRRPIVSVPTITCWGTCLYPFIWICIYQPSVSISWYIRIDIEIVADGI